MNPKYALDVSGKFIVVDTNIGYFLSFPIKSYDKKKNGNTHITIVVSENELDTISDMDKWLNDSYGIQPEMTNKIPEMKQMDHKWLERRLARENPNIQISELGKKVADILGHVFDGIHNCPATLFHKRTNWESNHHIELVIYGELATWDFNRLTRLVILCHDQCIRLSIEGANIHYLRLFFHTRKRGDDLLICKRHPTIEEQIKEIRSRCYVLSDM
jgi:hypothetical protein